MALEYKAKTKHTTMSIRFKIKASMNEFWTLLTLWYALFLPCTPVTVGRFLKNRATDIILNTLNFNLGKLHGQSCSN
jgi:hypothetical protein